MKDDKEDGGGVTITMSACCSLGFGELLVSMVRCKEAVT